jgi:serine/threonine protein phosphatase PrpC
MRVRDGDLLLLASDGLYDNLFSDEILTIVKDYS